MRKKKTTAPTEEVKQEYSFDLESVLLISSVVFNIREAIQQEAIKCSATKTMIPVSAIRDAVKKLCLGRFL